MRTFWTQAEYIELMTLLNITVFLHQFTLDLFELGTVDFFKPPTLAANKMVMVFVLVKVLVAQHTFAKINLSAQARFV